MFSIIQMMTAGLVAGIVMSIAAWLLQVIHFTTLDLIKYFGCFFTHKASGIQSFIAGFGFHIILSMLCPIAYVAIMYYLNLPLTILNGVYVGVVHTFVTGAILPIIDRIHACVAKGMVPSMGICTINYGLTSFVTWLAGHVIFSVVVFMMLMNS